MTADKNKKFLGPFFCISAAVIWGLSFVVQSDSADKISPNMFNFCRLVLGGLSLIPVILMQNKKQTNRDEEEKKKSDWYAKVGGGVCGVALCLGLSLQQTAFSYNLEAGKVGFITALYMLLVPLFGLIFKKRPALNVWIGVVIGTVGLYLICMKTDSLSLGKGEICSLLCAIGFALQILCIDFFLPKTDAVRLSCVQFFVAAALSAVLMFFLEEPSWQMIKDAWPAVLYAGILSSGVAFTFQSLGQQYTEPAVASLLLCLESAFSLFFGWVILHQVLDNRSMIGCCVMLLAVFLTQIRFRKKGKLG